jgi:hypothetical protein
MVIEVDSGTGTSGMIRNDLMDSFENVFQVQKVIISILHLHHALLLLLFLSRLHADQTLKTLVQCCGSGFGAFIPDPGRPIFV